MKLVGQLSYNGYSFNGSTQVNLQVEPVRDDAGRTTAYVRHALQVTWLVYLPWEIPSGMSEETFATQDTGTELQDIRTALMVQGAALVFTGQGFGSVAVNNGVGTASDVKWGPVPKSLSWRPAGSKYCAELTWTVEFALKSCFLQSGNQSNPLLAFNYSSAYSIDRLGRTTRRITGYLEIPLTRSGRKVPDTADSYRSLICPPIPAEFQRITQDFTVSADKSRLDFNIVDEETPSDNPYPLGVAKIDATHSVSWGRFQGAARLQNRLAAKIELAYNQPTKIAYDYFVRLVKDRTDKAKMAAQAANENVSLVFESLTIEEGLFDRTASFSCTWRFLNDIGGLVLSSIRERTGLFSAITTCPTWEKWAESVAPDNGVRGYQGLSESAASDAIVDLCGSSSAMPWQAGTSKAADAAAQTFSDGIVNDMPNSVTSWLEYRHAVEILESQPNVRQSILQAPQAVEGDADINRATPSVGTGIATLAFAGAAGYPDVITRGGQPRYQAIVRGHATRAGHQIPRPNYGTIGGATATRSDIRFQQWVAGKWLGLPIYKAIWEITYDLDRSPGVVQELAQIEQGVTGR